MTVALALGALALGTASSGANTSHADWPTIDGMLLTNKPDAARPLDARPGEDPFDGTDSTYSCDSVHLRGSCQQFFTPGSTGGFVVIDGSFHNELLGGHGNDVIHAGPNGDVIWGDYKPSGQPSSQTDQLFGGDGDDVIYPSHGRNAVVAGAGDDIIHAHFGSGTIDCGPGNDLVYLAKKNSRLYKRTGCERISYSSVGY